MHMKKSVGVIGGSTVVDNCHNTHTFTTHFTRQNRTSELASEVLPQLTRISLKIEVKYSVSSFHQLTMYVLIKNLLYVF